MTTNDPVTEARCPVCGHPVRVVSGDEGTNSYEPMDDLGAAWAEAEAALPEGWAISLLWGGERWAAAAGPWPDDGQRRTIYASADTTPAAALRALAAALRERE